MGIFSTIIVGFIAGLLARAIKPGNDAMGWVMTIILGIAGSFLGSFLARNVLGLEFNGRFISLAFSVIGAIILLFIYELMANKK